MALYNVKNGKDMTGLDGGDNKTYWITLRWEILANVSQNDNIYIFV